MDSLPRISVIIATFNRCHDLRRQIEALWHQTLPKCDFEIIVCSDGSTDGTDATLREFAARDWSLSYLTQANKGPAAARNAAARRSRARYLAFTDDDCVVAPDWLESIVKRFESSGAAGIQGKTTTERHRCTPLTHQIEVLQAWTNTVPTCNAAYLRSAFETVGGFDESFPFPHNEDTDLAWRIGDQGTIVFEESVHVFHPPRLDRFQKHVRAVRMFQSDFCLFRKNPSKYARYIARSPWVTLYWTIPLKHQWALAKFHVQCALRPFRPHHLLVSASLLACRWVALVWYFPAYYRSWKNNRPPRTRALGEA